MLYPFSRPWSPTQKWIILVTVSLCLVLAGAGIYAYELHIRREAAATLVDHQWSMQGCIDCSSNLTFRRDHTLEVEDDGFGGPYRGRGTWRLHGRNYLELEYELTMVQAPDLDLDHFHYRWHIAKLTPDELVVDDMRFPLLYKRVK